MNPKNAYVVQRATHSGWIDVDTYTQGIDYVISAKKRAKHSMRDLERTFKDHTYRVVKIVYEHT